MLVNGLRTKDIYHNLTKKFQLKNRQCDGRSIHFTATNNFVEIIFPSPLVDKNTLQIFIKEIKDWNYLRNNSLRMHMFVIVTLWFVGVDQSTPVCDEKSMDVWTVKKTEKDDSYIGIY